MTGKVNTEARNYKSSLGIATEVMHGA